ncbi:MAG: aminoglycoside phosphotransferase family protein [Flaviflexus sp.]|nr:aminoglycoside phosphotransferase family protein [Flaviflexus sp.]
MTPDQRAFLDRLGPWRILRDLGWGISDQEVLLVEAGGPKTVKCGGEANRHLHREIDAHTGPLRHFSATPALVAADRGAKILVLEHVPGTLADHAEPCPGHAEEAGALLAELHDLVPPDTDTTLDEKLTASALRWLSKPTGFDDGLIRRARAVLEHHEAIPLEVTFCHGDYSPRNWLIGERLIVLDFGRSGMRPPSYDFLQLLTHPWWPTIATDFLRGYGASLDLDSLRIQRIREAVTIGAWAHRAGQVDFHRRAQSELSALL